MTVATQQRVAERLWLPARVVEAERRDPALVTSAPQILAVGQPMMAEWEAESAIRLAYLANVYVFRCVQVIATAVAGLKFRAGGDPDSPGEFRTDAPLARLLGPPPGGPAPGITPRRLWAYIVAQYLVTGRFGVEIETEGRSGPPVALWPLTSSLLRPIPAGTGTAMFSGFEYGTGGKAKRLRADQVWYEWRPSMVDYRQPESVLQAARLSVSTAVMLDRYCYSFLVNDARPAAIIVHEAFAIPSEREAWRAQFLASHRGPQNAGRPLFAEAEGGQASGSIDVKTLGSTNKEAELIDQYEQQIKAICAAFGTPRSKLANSAESTFSNAGQDDVNWWRDTIKPLLEELADSVNIQIAPRLGDDVGWFDISRVPQLSSSKLLALGRALPPLIDNGTVVRDEVRAEVDLPPLPDGLGAVPTVGAAMTTLQAAEETPAAPAALPAASPVTGEPARSAVPDEPTAPPAPAPIEARLLARAPAPTVAPTTPVGQGPATEDRAAQDRSEWRRGEWRRVDSQVRSLEAAWRRSMRRLFADQQRQTLARLRGARRLLRRNQRADTVPVPDASAIFDVQAWADRTVEVATDLYGQTVALSFGRLSAMFGVPLDPDAEVVGGAPDPRAFIDGRANQLAGQVNQTTYEAVQEALTEGVDAGEGVDGIARRISDVFDLADRTRAETIARTEVISSYNGAAELGGRILGPDIAAGMEWIATADERTRPDHADADGQQVGIGESFDVGGEQLAYPGDPSASADNVVNCRCTLGILTPDEMDEAGRARRAEQRAAARSARARRLATALEMLKEAA